MQPPGKYRFTAEGYDRMAETGLLHPKARVELLDGEIIDMSPIGPLHGGVVDRLTRLFLLKSDGRWWLRCQNSLRLDSYSEPQPDLVLAKPSPDDYLNRLPRAEDVFLVVEVAGSSLAIDQENKLPLYGRAGVAEVWIVNLEEAAIEVYREPNCHGYGSKAVLREGAQARLPAFPDLAVDVAELFRR